MLAIGTVIGLLILALFTMVFRFISGISVFSSTIHIVAYVDNAAGLQPGAVVSLQGVGIGNVSSVQLPTSPPNPAQPVRIDMRVSGNQQQWLRQNSVVQVMTRGTMGDAAVNIQRGTPDSPSAVNGSVLPSRVATPSTAVVISAHTLLENTNLFMDQFGRMAARGKTGTVGKLMGPNDLDRTLATISRQTGELGAAIHSGSGTLAQLTSGTALPASLDSTRRSIASLRHGIADGNGSLGRFTRDRQFSTGLAQLRLGVDQTSANLNQGRGAVGRLLHSPSTREDLHAIRRNLQAITAANGSFQQVTRNPQLRQNTQTLAQSLHSLIREMKRHPKRFFRIHLDLF